MGITSAVKQTLLILGISLVVILPACTAKPENDAAQPAGQSQPVTKEPSPGAVPTKEDGYYMKAKIDGKQWVAAYMVPDIDPRSNDKQIQGEDPGTTINFMIWKPGVKVGMKKEFKESHAANLFTGDDIYGGRKGEFEITRADDQWTEGKFSFTATTSGSSKIIEVTEGFFRVPSR